MRGNEVKVTVSAEVNTILSDLYNQIEYELRDDYEDGLEKTMEELERYKNIIEIMERYFELIIDLSFDYDGLNEVKTLKVLIDELKNYASLGRAYNTTEPIYENNGKKYNILNEELKGSDN